MRQTRRFENVPASVPAARRFAGEVVRDIPDEALETLTLMVSELASNCVRHTGGSFELTLSQTETEVRVEATDQGTDEPRLRFPPPTDPSGRGLQIVNMLSTDWGFDRRPDSKVVWFTLDLRAAAGVES